MGKRFIVTILAVSVVAVMTGWSSVSAAETQDKLPSQSDPSCLKCHKYDKMPNIFAGKFKDVSSKAKSISLGIGKDTEVIFFDDATELKNAPTLKKIPEGESVKVVYYKKNGKNFAKLVEVKKGIDVPKEKLASAEEVAALVAKGPEKGKYVLLDSRPGKMYEQGHIATAVSMPFFAFDKLKDKVLPKDKEVLQIYYCAGFS
jgi:hypothetical protein